MQFLNGLYDSIQNLIAGINTTKDKRYHSAFAERAIDYATLDAMYRNDWISGKVVDIPVNDAVRKWRSIVCESLSQDQLDEIALSEKKLQVKNKFAEAMRWSRLYGGAVIVMGIDDGLPPDQPLEVDKVKLGSLKYMHVFDRHDVTVATINQIDPYSETFRKPETYRLSGSSQEIHASRMLIFDGRPLPWRVRQRNDYWGESYVAHVYDAILHSQGTVSAIASLPYKAVVDIIAVSGFFNACEIGGKPVSTLTRRFQAADQIKSINNALVIDRDLEEISQQAIQFTGLSDIIMRFMNIVAAASDIPATRFLGESAPGLNSAGQMELRNHYDAIASYQDGPLRSQLELFDEIHLRSLYGRVPDDWSFYFEPLWQSSELEQSQIELSRAQRDQTYMVNGVLLPGQIAEQLKKDGTYETITDEYIETLKEIDEEELEETPEEVAPKMPEEQSEEQPEEQPEKTEGEEPFKK